MLQWQAAHVVAQWLRPRPISTLLERLLENPSARVKRVDVSTGVRHEHDRNFAKLLDETKYATYFMSR